MEQSESEAPVFAITRPKLFGGCERFLLQNPSQLEPPTEKSIARHRFTVRHGKKRRVFQAPDNVTFNAWLSALEQALEPKKKSEHVRMQSPNTRVSYIAIRTHSHSGMTSPGRLSPKTKMKRRGHGKKTCQVRPYTQARFFERSGFRRDPTNYKIVKLHRPAATCSRIAMSKVEAPISDSEMKSESELEEKSSEALKEDENLVMDEIAHNQDILPRIATAEPDSISIGDSASCGDSISGGGKEGAESPDDLLSKTAVVPELIDRIDIERIAEKTSPECSSTVANATFETKTIEHDVIVTNEALSLEIDDDCGTVKHAVSVGNFPSENRSKILSKISVVVNPQDKSDVEKPVEKRDQNVIDCKGHATIKTEAIDFEVIGIVKELLARVVEDCVTTIVPSKSNIQASRKCYVPNSEAVKSSSTPRDCQNHWIPVDPYNSKLIWISHKRRYC
ncbi:hypothetical protein CCR75_003749 [Bremia lactucae]|uniref:PH domain-containing protein n=1 Tax=Bremia lactucae TaxID=4779 RepID=A0A976FL34_BRELC|nr:hypothetical protein CCR75_003749 [Bremia lactucae]